MADVPGSILVVDDDDGIRTAVRLALEDHGYAVREAPDGETALAEIKTELPEVVVLDLMLPGMDGFECCRQLRRISDVPVLIVSARGDSHDVVAGLEAGADDYIRKPFDVPELVARLRALRRRVRPATAEPAVADPADVSVKDLTVRPDSGEVSVAGRAVRLTKTEMRLLYEMASHPGRVFSREALLERVWDYGYFGDARLVDVHVRRLRSKIEDDPAHPRRLVTVRGFGYKLDP
ncbi:MAG TPA: response regulator transcription factor [Mycobacteriales bacterium]|jgi:DNA-binding response OmpR family regulator|nr:response regulator transcription factor [Mycobacteriales bacterium]